MGLTDDLMAYPCEVIGPYLLSVSNESLEVIFS